MKKKLAAIALVVVMVAMLFTGLTMAYFTDTGTVTNTFTVGKIAIDVFEHKLEVDEETFVPKLNEEGNPYLTETEVQANTYAKIVPGVVYPKDPTVRNSGNVGAYVRMLVTVNKGVFNDLHRAGYTNLGVLFNGHDEEVWKFVDSTDEGNKVTYTYEYIANDGILAKDKEAILFTSFKLPEGLKQEQIVSADWDYFELTITGHAIQSDGFANAAEAWAAFAAQQ